MKNLRTLKSGAFTIAGLSLLLAACDVPAELKTAPAETENSAVVWPETKAAGFYDPAVEERIDTVLARMTVEEKVGQVIQADSASVTAEEVRKYNLGSVLSGGNSAPGPYPYAKASEWVATADEYFEASIDTSDGGVGIPIIWGIDAVHGHNNVIGGTVFPHNIALGAANNPALIRAISEITAKELRVTGHDWTFAPTLAVPRDDRWGRSYEGYSETPEITKAYATAIVEGLQGVHGTDGFFDSSRVISSAKHFVADGGTTGGRDQGNAEVSEEELRDVHGIAYVNAIDAGVQAIMASFSSWNGEKVHGSKHLLTNVLKKQMGFDGLIVGDWNAHGQIEGCTNESCPQSINAGLDMFMAPDSWKGLYYNTLKQVQAGEISMERLDDAVRRILRVKIRAGIFELPKPSEREYAADEAFLGSAEHRAVARQAVRESLVLLKNNDDVLPAKPDSRILVVGTTADSISAASGGWTLTWQGGGLPNSLFPNGDSILAGLMTAASAAGGTVEYSEDGTYTEKPDLVIAVYGEKPYAEFQGDVDTLLYEEAEILDQLKKFQADGIKTVSVYLSGRPMWVNPLINASDAFVAAWWPGTEGGGVADVLLADSEGNVRYDFKGKLSFSWPKTPNQTPLNVGDENYDPLFAYGYGLTYGEETSVPALSEDKGSAGVSGNKYQYFAKGKAQEPWVLKTDEGMSVKGTDKGAQEDAIAVSWPQEEAQFAIVTSAESINLFREMNGAMELAFSIRADNTVNAPVSLGIGCYEGEKCNGFLNIDSLLGSVEVGVWQDVRVNLSCFKDTPVDMEAVTVPFILTSSAGRSISLADIQLVEDSDGKETCPQ